VQSSPRRALAAAVLVVEAFVVCFAGLAIRAPASESGAGRAEAALTTCLVLALLCVVVAGTLRRRAGYPLGSALQVAVVATGFWAPTMFFLGVVFAALWVVALRVGARIERERAAFTPPSPSPLPPSPPPPP
jgi:cbb3-type cytochrome oxidase subunit 3